jgi:hypothetical protein
VNAIRYPERHKKSGVYYAVTPDGVELPIVDIEHPAFALPWSADEQRAQLEQFMRGQVYDYLPAAVGRPVMTMLLTASGSVLARGMRRAQGTFLSGLDTYLYKIGSENLNDAYVKPIDHKIAESFPSLMVRLRLQDMVQLMAAEATMALGAEPQRTLHLLNIAGGPAIDSLNMLLTWQRHAPGLLTQRAIRLSVLDLDSAGPAFGQRALEVLCAPGGPLAGLRVEMRHLTYNFGRAYELQPLLAAAQDAGELVLASSEGGLFEYGSDEEIVSNLRELRAGAPPGFLMVGSVTRADPPRMRLARMSTAATRPRGLTAFGHLLDAAGFELRKARERPFSDAVLIAPRPRPARA